MSNMFRGSSATTLDLSSFDTSNVTNMTNMFYGCSATTGYARTQADADRFNNSSGKPSALVFGVKQEGDNMYVIAVETGRLTIDFIPSLYKMEVARILGIELDEDQD